MASAMLVLVLLGFVALATFGAPAGPAPGPQPQQQQPKCPDGFADKLEDAYETCMSEGGKEGGKSKRSLGPKVNRERRSEKAAEEHQEDELSPEMISCAVEAVRKEIPEIDKMIKECEGEGGAGGEHKTKREEPKAEKKEGGSGDQAHCFIGKLKTMCPDLEGLE